MSSTCCCPRKAEKSDSASSKSLKSTNNLDKRSYRHILTRMDWHKLRWSSRGAIAVPSDWPTYKFEIKYDSLPALLPLEDQKLLAQALRHKSSVTEAGHVGLCAESLSYKRLETEGDALLQSFAIVELPYGIGGITSGHLNLIKEIVATNATLARLSLHYNIPYNLVVGNALGNSPHLITQKVAADAFEAYIGALFRQAKNTHTQSSLTEWLHSLYNEDNFPALAQYLCPPNSQSGEVLDASASERDERSGSEDGNSEV